MEIYTRNGHRITDKFPELREAASAIRSHSAHCFLCYVPSLIVPHDYPATDTVTQQSYLRHSRYRSKSMGYDAKHLSSPYL
jgi:hypothetical protein